MWIIGLTLVAGIVIAKSNRESVVRGTLAAIIFVWAFSIMGTMASASPSEWICKPSGFGQKATCAAKR